MAVATVVLGLFTASFAHADAYDDGKELYDQRNWSAALGRFQQAARERPGEAKVQWMLGLTYLKLRNGPGATAAFEQAQRLDPGIGFTKRDKFLSRLARARAMSGLGAVAAPPPPVAPMAPAPMPGAPAAARLFPEAFLNQVAVDLMQNRRFVRDYTNMLGADVSRLEQKVAEVGGVGYDMRIVFMPATWATRLQSFTAQVFQFMKGGARDIVIVGTPRGANAKAGSIRDGDMQRILMANKGQFAVSYGQGMWSIANDVGKVVGLKAGRAESKKKTWIIVLAVVGGILLIIIVIAVVRSRRRRAAEEAEYRAAYGKAIEMMEPVSDRLSSAQLSAQIVDDEDARMLVRRAEANYFSAQALMQKIPAPGKGEPDPAGVRRLAGMLHEADEALEKAETIMSRKLGGKPIDKDKILEQGGKKLGCYFCSRPLRDESSGRIMGIELKGQKMDVLACHPCAEEHDRGSMPKVRMVEHEGRPVHWSMVPGYDPWYDYYHYDRYRATWVDAFVLATIFDWALWHSHPSPYVIWHPPGYYAYTTPPVYYNFDAAARDHDVDAVIGSAWSTGGAPSGIDFGGPMGGGVPEAPGGRDVS
jgi:hypothetical protein